MISNLTLKNFRKHTDLTIDFTPGINVLRAANEGGKSTLLEAIAYTLFGYKVLRTPLEQTVTWGENVNSLKVTLVMTLGGDVLTISRGKSGAEVTKNGKVFCTGQTEVTNLISSLLGADANTAGKLLLANQNSIRGALDGGPKELSELIEKLSDMSVFDQILDAAQEKLALGSPNLLEERLKGAQATLEAATSNMPNRPNDVTYGTKVSELQAQIADTNLTLAGLELGVTSTDMAWRYASALYMKRVGLEAEVTKATENVERAKAQVVAFSQFKDVTYTDSRPALQAELKEAEGFDARVGAYRVFKDFPKGLQYPGTDTEFEAWEDECQKALNTATSALRSISRKVETVKARRINHEICDKCGQSVTHLTTVIETNAAVDAELAQLVKEEFDADIELKQVTSHQEDASAIRRYASKVQPYLNKLHGYVTLDETGYPTQPEWIGFIPDVGPDADAIRARLTKAETEIKAIESGKAKLELAESQLSDANIALDKAEEALKSFEAPDAQAVCDATEAKDQAILNLNAAKGTVILAQQEIDRLVTEHATATQLWNMAAARIADAEKVIAECQKDLGSLMFNNGLVKRLRAIRPIVASKIWNSVLASVSVMFSQMRGEPSDVTREATGFKVNGQAVESLSGSTLDVLGVALRCALLRTFIPNCGLLVLDEPAQGCDSERTESLLGFLQSLGMGQTLLVTHEDVSSSIADHIIEI